MSKQSQITTPINEKRVKGLASSLNSLPKSGFSRCIVFYCLLALTIIIITGYVLTYMGHDVDTITTVAIGGVCSELLFLSAKRILSRQEKIEDIVLEEIHKELNDGIEYPVSTETTTITQTDASGDKSTTTITKETSQSNQSIQPKDDNSFYNTSFNNDEAQGEEIEENVEEDIEPEPEVKSQPKKRGRPKKSTTQTKSTTQSKQAQTKQEEEFVSDWLVEDMSD